jgi:hypothetical protein
MARMRGKSLFGVSDDQRTILFCGAIEPVIAARRLAVGGQRSLKPATVNTYSKEWRHTSATGQS